MLRYSGHALRGGLLESGFSLVFTDCAARNRGERDASTLPPEELITLFSYRFTPDTRKWRRRVDRVRP